MQNLIHFIKYNNAVSIGFAIMFLSFGGAFAASPDLRETVVASETQVVQVDNSAIVGMDLSTYSPTATITNIAEDNEEYQVSFTLETIAVADGVWREVVQNQSVTVKKRVLRGEDLGLYMAEQLSQLTERELAKLKEVQAIEKKTGTSQKVVATVYSGLIGKLIEPKQETFSGYNPVIIPKPKKTRAEYLAEAALSAQQAPVVTSTSGGPVLTINGNNPAEILVGASYSDLGVVVADDKDNNLGHTLSLNGVGVTSISIDTSVAGTHTILYRAVDQDGNVGTATRTVIVSAPAQPAPTTATTTPTTATTTTPTADTTPPVITLLGQSSLTLEVGGAYTDAGATASDDVDGDLTSSIIVVNPVDVATVGTYTVTYNVSDLSGNNALQVTRTVTVNAPTDTTPPVISLIGPATIEIASSTPYSDQGATALDDVDGDITVQIVVINPVDTSVVGEYTISYNVSDSSGNPAVEVTRVVTVASE